MASLMKELWTSRTMCVALLALVVLLPACTHKKIVQLGTHKVTIARHGFEKKFHVTENASVPTFEYAGLSTDGKGLKVSIRGDKVTVNGVDGNLRAGDSVFISDEGVRVNSLDYGESEKYLLGNTSTSEATLRN